MHHEEHAQDFWQGCSLFLQSTAQMKEWKTKQRGLTAAMQCSIHAQHLFAGQRNLKDGRQQASWGGAQQSVCSHRPSFPWLEPTAVTGASKHKHDLHEKTPPTQQHCRISSSHYSFGTKKTNYFKWIKTIHTNTLLNLMRTQSLYKLNVLIKKS